MRKVEPMAAKKAGVTMYQLMERAGLAVFHALRSNYSGARRLLVLAGKGNNGGDAYVVARLALQQGMSVTFCEFTATAQLPADAAKAREMLLLKGVRPTAWQDIVLPDYDVCIDGLLGTGLVDAVRAPLDSVIQQLNSSGVPVVSIDIPSGLDADTGSVCGVAVQAAHTMTFVGTKSGLVTGIGRQYTGNLHFNDLGIGNEFQRLADFRGRVFDFRSLRSLPKRDIYSHKGTFGKLLCVGGNVGMSGAIRLTGEAALRCGAGLVKVFCHPDSGASVMNGRPELMVENRSDCLREVLSWCTTIVIGPGLGRDEWSETTLKTVLDHALEKHKPIVIDADALNLYAQNRRFILPKHLAIVTPHPAEAARILKCSVKAIEANRYAVAKTIASQYDCVALLKGAGSIVASQDNFWVCDNGNPGMATAGMGDVLSGVLGALLAQGMGLRLSAVYGMCLHSYAGDLASVAQGERGMLASDLFPYIRQLIN